jgi:hypothetical protein
MMEAGRWGTDMDLGEMFLNFTLHESLQAFYGIDLTPYFLEELKSGCQALWEWCTRCLMGLKILPYQTIWMCYDGSWQMGNRHGSGGDVFELHSP